MSKSRPKYVTMDLLKTGSPVRMLSSSTADRGSI